MVRTSFLFLALATATTIVGTISPWQSLEEIMYWLTIVMLAVAAGFVLIHIGSTNPNE